MAILAAVPAGSAAQYFGPNKVQYKRLEFQVLATEHFDIYFHQEQRESVEVVGRLAERWWQRLSKVFGKEPEGRQPLVLYSSHVTFEQTQVVPGLIDPGVGGLTEPRRRRIVMPFAVSLAETDHVLGHELVHAFQFDLLANEPLRPERGGGGLSLWMMEGLAEYLSLGRVSTHTSMWLRDAALHEKLPSIGDLDNPSYFPYRWGHAFWAYTAGRWGDHVIIDLFLAAWLSGPESAINLVLGITADEFTADWHAAIREAYKAPDAPIFGRALVEARTLGGSTNVGPALSPDGRWIAFLSEREFFSIDVFIADAKTGKVAGRLTDTAGDAHYSNLQVIDSAGAWDRDSQRLAVGTVTGGRAAISVFRWPGGAREAEVTVADVDEIYNPTWSPDGRAIAFSAMNGGVTDLLVYDFDRKVVRRLTADLYADMQPVWEPDGRRIAFVTDRFTSNLARFSFGEYRLAIIDVESGAIEAVAALPAGKHISPQWSPDGRSLYFVSDSEGTSDLYRVELASGVVDRLTRAPAGVSGITAASPAVSVASYNGAVAMTVFEQSRYAIYRLEVDECKPLYGGTQPDALVGNPKIAGALPPIRIPELPVPAAPVDPAPALNPPASVSKYRPRLSLDRVSNAGIGIGVDRLGPTAGSGVGLVFSDMLNTHSVVTALQLNQGIGVRDAALFGAYLNQARRWNWGLIGSSIPAYVGVRSDTTESLSSSLLFGPVEVMRQTEQAGALALSYAFNRARRVEFHGGVSRLSFDRFVLTSPEDGEWSDGEWTMAAPPLVLGSASAAFVHDTTSFGSLSAVRGTRYRLEAAPTIGTIRYVSILADYRKYLMPVPFYTVAARVLHFARYGSGADDPRIAPLYLGYPSLVRGYEVTTLTTSQCVVPLSKGCPELERLIGSRIAVANLELRFPLLRPFGVSRQMYGPVPVEVAFFTDGGVVWDRSKSSSPFRGGNAWSAGVTLRTSVIGLGLAQFDIVRPFRTPDAGWALRFHLSSAI
jgi:Tol biopolymer transport system component